MPSDSEVTLKAMQEAIDDLMAESQALRAVVQNLVIHAAFCSSEHRAAFEGLREITLERLERTARMAQGVPAMAARGERSVESAHHLFAEIEPVVVSGSPLLREE